jgi:hypothetical protein
MQAILRPEFRRVGACGGEILLGVLAFQDCGRKRGIQLAHGAAMCGSVSTTGTQMVEFSAKPAGTGRRAAARMASSAMPCPSTA